MKRVLVAGIVGVGLVLVPTSTAEAKTPKPCVDALSHAENVVAANRDFAQAVADYFTKNAAAASLGATGSTAGVTAFLHALTDNTSALKDTINGITARVGPEVSAYNTAATACRAKA